jgi:excisionase family DNA binding protein
VTDRLLTAEQVAELLQVPVSWVRAETRAGRLPFVALGRYRRYDRDRLLEWVEGLSAGGNGAATYRKHEPKATA